MAPDGALRSAAGGRQARARSGGTEVFDPAGFTDADWAALSGAWRSLGEDAGRAGDAGQDGLGDADDAFVRRWGVDPAQIAVPVLLVHGQQDRMVPPGHAGQMPCQSGLSAQVCRKYPASCRREAAPSSSSTVTCGCICRIVAGHIALIGPSTI